MVTHHRAQGRRRKGGAAALTLVLIVFVAIGSVMVFYVWEGINELLAGQLVPSHLLLGLAMLVALALLLIFVARYIQRYDRTVHQPRSPTAPPTTHDSGG